jgi:hypothetical protein
MQAKEESVAAAATATTGSNKEKKKETALKKAFRGRIEELLKPYYKKKEVCNPRDCCLRPPS